MNPCFRALESITGDSRKRKYNQDLLNVAINVCTCENQGDQLLPKHPNLPKKYTRNSKVPKKLYIELVRITYYYRYIWVFR